MAFSAGSAIAAGVSTGASIYQGQRQEKLQKKALKDQEDLATKATAEQLAQRRRNEMEMRRVNRKKPDIEQLLFANEDPGLADDLLTGNTGVNPGKIKLGRDEPLGGGA